MLYIPSHHQCIMGSIESMANSTYTHPKSICTAMDSLLKVDLLERAYAQPFWWRPKSLNKDQWVPYYEAYTVASIIIKILIQFHIELLLP